MHGHFNVRLCTHTLLWNDTTDSLAIQVIDLLHPLATIHWEEWLKSSLFKTHTYGSQHILFKSKPYLFTKDGILMYEYDSDSLAKVKLPTYTKGISIYRSQLVLVGGLDPTTRWVTNKVWVSDDGSKWEPSLPPLPITCKNPLVVNTGSPEYLIVIGGQIVDDCIDVHVMMGEQWLLAEPMPLNSSYVRRFPVNRIHTDFSAHVIHNRNLLVLRRLAPSIYCNLDALLATVGSGFLKKTSKSVWRRFDMPSSSFNLLFLENCVTTAGGIHPMDLNPKFDRCGNIVQYIMESIKQTPKICAYSPFTQTWIQVGDLPHSYQHSLFSESSSAHGSLFLLGGELVLVMAQEGSEQKTLKASVKSKQISLSSKLVVTNYWRQEKNRGACMVNLSHESHKGLTFSNQRYLHAIKERR